MTLASRKPVVRDSGLGAEGAMASPGSAMGIGLPFARALSCREGLWGSEAEAPAGLTAVSASFVS